MGKLSPAGKPVPLARLLLMSYRLLIDGLHRQLSARGWHDVRPAYGFVLLAARNQPTTSTELAFLLGVSKQAASKLLDAMDEAGLVRRVPDPADARVKLVELAPRGRQLLEAVEAIYGELEGEWAAAVGSGAVEETRRCLTEVVRAAHGGELPAVRAGP